MVNKSWIYFLHITLQGRMADIFMDIFGDKLVKENLVEIKHLNRLPSPNELQGKIILKGTEAPPAVKFAKKLTAVRRST